MLRKLLREHQSADTSDVISLPQEYAEPRSFDACLRFFYRREEPSSSTGAEHLARTLGAATALDVDELGDLVFAQLYPLVTVDNVVRVIKIADFHGINRLLELCAKICADQMSSKQFEDMIMSLTADCEGSAKNESSTSSLPRCQCLTPCCACCTPDTYRLWRRLSATTCYRSYAA